MMGVNPVYAPGKLPVKFRMKPIEQSLKMFIHR